MSVRYLARNLVENNNGLEAEISGYLGRCPYYAILEVEEGFHIRFAKKDIDWIR